MKEIKLTQNRITIVDDEDFDYLSSFSWCFGSVGYPETRTSVAEGRKLKRMHSLILKTPKGLMCDHINGNKLDNRKSNLRLCTMMENMRNRNKTSTNKSGYKGVYFEEYTGKWKAQIKYGNKNHNLGRFEKLKDAAKAYNMAAIENFGEFARINLI